MRAKRRGQAEPSRRRPTAAFRTAVRAEFFASRLFSRGFVRQIEAASRPVLPPGPKREREEVLEAALLQAYDRRGHFRGQSEEDLRRWVLRIVSSLAREARRGKRRRPDGGGPSRN